jgi:hypothetical protein
MIAMELARELKVAGLPWEPRRGDLAMDRLNVAYLVIATGADDAGAVAIDTGHGIERRNYLGLTWIPRLDQLAAFLARHGAVEMSAAPTGEGRRDVTWQVTVETGTGAPARSFHATDPADASGKALHYLLAEAGWHAGPPLRSNDL